MRLFLHIRQPKVHFGIGLTNSWQGHEEHALTSQRKNWLVMHADPSGLLIFLRYARNSLVFRVDGL